MPVKLLNGRVWIRTNDFRPRLVGEWGDGLEPCGYRSEALLTNLATWPAKALSYDNIALHTNIRGA